ncbi:dihydrofolate reductase family protein [Paenibacillus albus]|uniref:Dihydrofolate reductase n=1 Tax=Paenibacillus albus TaxID=2495582 RepID=A0A3S9A675_9BACL|nr:dihydrofolate reductase family protein [Paenibacillus albus]AZN41238.1 dihydrofolate reductase [Paenibacillus albus]
MSSTSAAKRRIILDLAVTLDGYIEGSNGEVDWCIMEPDMGFADFLEQIDTILYGRKSYDLWGQYDPGVDASDTDQELWQNVHRKAKVAFSRAKRNDNQQVKWISENIVEEVNKLKSTPGKDIWLYGGASLITTFVNLGLVDEYRLSVHPVILGAGKPMFADISQRLNLALTHTRTFSSGVVQLIYREKENDSLQ